MTTVLVTGGSGFIGVHCIVQLLNAGYRVRTTLRDLARESEVRSMVSEGGVRVDDDSLTFLAADLGADAAWAEAARGCEFVIHPASPTPAIRARTDDDFIVPARDGVLRVLRASRDAGVKRVVLTSAFGAIVWSKVPKRGPYLETDWSDTDDSVPLYQRSKTLSERAAWDFIARESAGLELSVVNPVAVLGPVLGPDTSHSISIVKQHLRGELKGSPKVYSPYVDVRDVASLHLLAMTQPAAKNERFIATAPGTWSMADVARVLSSRLGQPVSTRELPNWVVRLAALRNPTAKMVLPHLGVVRETSGEKAERLLGWKPRPFEEGVVATAQSLQKLGVV